MKIIKNVIQDINIELEKRIIELTTLFSQAAKAKKTLKLMKTFFNNSPDDDQIKNFLKDEIRKSFPDADKLLSKLELSVVFKDVTYDTLKND